MAPEESGRGDKQLYPLHVLEGYELGEQPVHLAAMRVQAVEDLENIKEAINAAMRKIQGGELPGWVRVALEVLADAAGRIPGHSFAELAESLAEAIDASSCVSGEKSGGGWRCLRLLYESEAEVDGQRLAARAFLEDREDGDGVVDSVESLTARIYVMGPEGYAGVKYVCIADRGGFVKCERLVDGEVVESYVL